jgi:hypothetical protein
MALNYTEKGSGMHEAIRDAGYVARWVDNIFATPNIGDEPAIQTIIDTYDQLAAVKVDKIIELKAEGLARIQTIYPAINDWDDLDLVRDQYLSVAPAARQATAEFQAMIDIFQAGKDAATVIAALATIANVEAYDAVNTPVWP